LRDGGIVKIKRLDHLVLTVGDVDATWNVYTRVLGMQVVSFGAGRRALCFGRQKSNFRNPDRNLIEICNYGRDGAASPPRPLQQ